MHDGRGEQTRYAGRDQRHMQNALQHAFSLQHRKDIEAEIVTMIETLSEIPQAARPTSDERKTFVSSMTIFQPSHFEDLVAERVAQSSCGYGLCGRPLRPAKTLTLQLDKTAQSYCSKECQATAAYIKSQLHSVPVWERSATDRVTIVLPEDNVVGTPVHSRRREANAELAFERGEKITSTKPEKVMTATVVEKRVTTSIPTAPQFEFEDDSIEGYIPKKKDGRAPGTFTDLSTMQTISHDVAPSSTTDTADDSQEKAWRDMFQNMQTGP